MPRRLGPTTLLRSEVEVPVTGLVSLLGLLGEHAGHRAQTDGDGGGPNPLSLASVSRSR